MLPLGLICLTALAAPVDLPLANPGFEQDLVGWSVALPAKNSQFFSLDETVRRSGQKSLRVACDDATANPWITAPARDLAGGATYAFSAWVRGEADRSAEAALKIEYYNAASENTSGHYARLVVKDGEWQRLVVEQPADAGVVKATVLLRMFGTGTLWFDDISFARTADPPPFTLAPPRLAGAGPRQ
ncbi:MAG: carbohydrate binding domain-containing protein, partial [Armatimonadetes bacterium]|nr:carbohydrate binding domain-containing protein [Armatimonadota bacterium]